jgi:hypothetical protein
MDQTVAWLLRDRKRLGEIERGLGTGVEKSRAAQRSFACGKCFQGERLGSGEVVGCHLFIEKSVYKHQG